MIITIIVIIVIITLNLVLDVCRLILNNSVARCPNTRRVDPVMKYCMYLKNGSIACGRREEGGGGTAKTAALERFDQSLGRGEGLADSHSYRQ